MNNNLTTQELEALAQAWFDGLLTREEESVLKRVLSDTAPHSPLLDECRLAMGFESAARHCRQRSPRRRRIWMPAAASAAVAIGLGFAATMLPQNEQIEVYIAGKRVDDPHTARDIALRNMHATLAEMQHNIDEAMRSSEQFEAMKRNSQELINQANQNLQL